MFIFTLTVKKDFVPECNRIAYCCIGSPEIHMFGWLREDFTKEGDLKIINPFIIIKRPVEKKVKIALAGKIEDQEYTNEFAPFSAATRLCFKKRSCAAGYEYTVPKHMIVPTIPEQWKLDLVMERFGEESFFRTLENATRESEKIFDQAFTVYTNAAQAKLDNA